MSSSITFSYLSNRLRDALQSANPGFKLGHASDILATAFGYRSDSSLKASAFESPSYDDVTHWVIHDDSVRTRTAELGFSSCADQLIAMIHAVIKIHIPNATLYANEVALFDKLQEWVNQQVDDSDSVSFAIPLTNNQGVAETYVPIDFSFAELGKAGELKEFDVPGHVTVVIDEERPYSGHKIIIKAKLSIIRLSQYAIAAPDIDVDAHLDYDWDEEASIPKVSLKSKLAEELDIDPDEAEELIDVEPLEISSDDGVIYHYEYDFEEAASPELRIKLLEKHGSFKLTVFPSFFVDVHTDPY